MLAVAVLTLFGARWAERVVAEDLGQDYVHGLRRRLIGAALAEDAGPSLGVTITRASNDLTAVRTWVARGLVALLTSLPFVVLVVVVLGLSDWRIGLAVGLPVVLFGLAVPPLARAALRRARTLRRHRGRMSGRIADAVRAREGIRAAGGVRRELNALDRDSRRVVGAAVGRSRVTGLVRAAALTAASLSTGTVVVLGSLAVVDAAAVASAMMLVGVLTTPLGDLGRVVEYRQNYRAARRIQAPLLARGEELLRAERELERDWARVPRDRSVTGRNGVWIEGLVVGGRPVPALLARAGERVVLDARDPARAAAVLDAVLAGRNDPAQPGAQALRMVVDGYDYTRAPARERRGLLGHASARVPLERGTIERAVTYRDPRATEDECRRALGRVGLGSVLEALPRGTQTRLRDGGRPLTGPQAARLKLGRALLGDPPVLVLDGLDAELDDEGVRLLRRELADYPGVVLVTSHDPGRIAPGHRSWTIDGP
ncbi:ABC transporter ATP-binding protein [Citricoccus sp. SGAir0253]|nr:ABC transporter ATP-binding protein [Citricoccus sp. SGAir0253]